MKIKSNLFDKILYCMHFIFGASIFLGIVFSVVFYEGHPDENISTFWFFMGAIYGFSYLLSANRKGKLYLTYSGNVYKDKSPITFYFALVIYWCSLVSIFYYSLKFWVSS